MPIRSSQDAEFLIVGGGPTGLGAAERLEELGANWRLLERESTPGGLAASYSRDGFTWDIGGHVIFSHYPAYDALLDRMISANGWTRHPRRAFVHHAGYWIPYPLQGNLFALPEGPRRACVDGLRARAASGHAPDRSTFARFIRTCFGDGIAEVFMEPYNRKVWSHPLETMSTAWLGERVAPPDPDTAERRNGNVPRASGWGPNNRFRFPVRGGTGALWLALAHRLNASRLDFDSQVVRIDPHARNVETADGRAIGYRRLISTIPLTCLVDLCALDHLRSIAASLRHAAVDVIGLGLHGDAPASVRDKSWMYFADADVPFYRATVFSNYSRYNAPAGCWSLLLEVSHSSAMPRDTGDLAGQCLAACRRLGMIDGDVASTWHYHAPYGYPVPTIDRDAALETLNPALEALDIYSRGRFGAWKYEVGNMDHSYMQGRELVGRLLLGESETTINNPARVNGS